MQTATTKLNAAVQDEIKFAKKANTPLVWRLLRRMVILGNTPQSGDPKKDWEHAKEHVNQARKKVNDLLTELENAVGKKAAQKNKAVKAVKEFTAAVQKVRDAKGDLNLLQVAQSAVTNAVKTATTQLTEAVETAETKE